MRFIDTEGKTPVNTPADPDIPDWTPWTQAQWDFWLQTSETYCQELQRLHALKDIPARNKYIDDHSAHWGKLKTWLKVLSKGKCWFSEVRELYSHYDVEHFRPKKEAKEFDDTVRDGYWWLAFDYTNYRLCGNVGNRKKGGWFPLKPNSICSSFDNPCEETEEAYLLDPTDEDDVNLIAFDEEGKAIPAPTASAWEQQCAEETITRLKLNDHPDLLEARRKIWQKVNFQVDRYKYFKGRCSQGGNPAAKMKLKEHGKNIRNLTESSSELSSVARWCIFFREDAQLSRLVA